MTDLYTWLKALHVAAALVFVAGVLGVAVFLSASQDVNPAAARAIRRWDMRVTTPAMILVWAFGLTLAVTGDWSRSGWLIAKLVLVVVLSGLHGMQSAKLRRVSGGVSTRVLSPLSAPFVVVSCLGIAVLVIVKPI
ncbi:CopD family protein [Methylobacterium iners]|uniref:Protoporphyrinogen IX oxidase n=1 Tax=Methylobacterium iners TaxID=418707 RepID=A0ABQ4S141_9HYPH|nr:CopD family protein [Methylobacterium iners]GJD96148.1 hypothetical protein OCOJLMKI_3366 [Methylobacterium iners]